MNGPYFCSLCGFWPARETELGLRCHICETREWADTHPVPLPNGVAALRDLAVVGFLAPPTNCARRACKGFAMSSNLPPLPQPPIYGYLGHYFTADQMHAYGEACAAAERADADRWRYFIEASPRQEICFLGESYFGKVKLDAAVDAAMAEKK